MRRLPIWTSYLLSPRRLGAEEPSCGDIASTAEWRAPSQCPCDRNEQAEPGKATGKAVAAYRSFQLNPRSRPDAERLLALIPAGDAEPGGRHDAGEAFATTKWSPT